MAAVGNWTFEAIVYAIECGEFAEYNGYISQEYYDTEHNRNVVVTMRNNGFELASLEVEITDEENEFELSPELLSFLEFKAEQALREADKEAWSEAKYLKMRAVI